MPHTARKRHKQKLTGEMFCFDSPWLKDASYPSEILESIGEPKTEKQTGDN